MRGLALVTLCLIILGSFSLFLSYNISPAYASEPSLVDIFDYLGFTNVAEANVETFPMGTYNITLYAEFAALYDDENELSYYEVGTNTFTVIFTGSEGNFGYVSPKITKTFSTEYQFGLSLFAYAHGYRYFSETFRNHDGEQYAKVYRNLEDLNMFLIGFDERSYCNGTGDKDYNDMVLSLQLQHYLAVVSPYDTPSGEGWYYNGTNAFAHLADNIVDHGNGTRRVFTHWGGDASGKNYSSSNPIYMNRNKTAIANWKTQHYLTVQTDPTTLSIAPTPPSDWYDESVNVTLTAPNENYLDSIKYLFDYWTIDGISQSSGANSVTVYMNQTHEATAHYKLATYTLAILPSTGGTTNPVTGNYTYTAGTNATIEAIPDAGYHFEYWLQDGFNAGSINPITILMDSNHTLQAIFTPSPLLVTISPLSASIRQGGSVFFTSTVSGGILPYTYQWYSNGNRVPEATLNTWTFTPASIGVYYIYLEVTDANNNTAQSETAKITVSEGPVGGYSTSLTKSTTIAPLISYTTFLVIFVIILRLIRPTRKLAFVFGSK